MTVDATVEELTAEDLGRVHLIGIGGVGMSGLGRLLLTRGIPVSGSELREWPQLAGLRALGGTIHMEHTAANLDGVDTVVYSTAIPADHLELVEARERGLRVLHRSQALAAAMRGRRAIAIAGTHGKTTTTSMTTQILQHANLDPSFVIGGEISEVGSNGHHGGGELFVVEADESDRSFLRYRPHVAIITNIGEDHLNTYGTVANLAATFLEFAELTDPAGFIVTCADNELTRELAAKARADGVAVYTYGEAADADLRLTDLASTGTGARYFATLDAIDLGEVRLPSPGRHLALNSAAALLATAKLGVPVDAAVEALASFPGVRRRFEHKGTVADIRVYDEYAFHPTSMTATLGAYREVAGEGRLIVVFMPNRVYRTRQFQSGIAAALAIADEAVILEVFGPGEARGPGEGGAPLTAAVPLPDARKAFVPGWEDAIAEAVRRARGGDLIVTMGAPPISLMGDEILRALAAAYDGSSSGESSGAAAVEGSGAWPGESPGEGGGTVPR